MAKRILLPNGCSCSYPSVVPKDWLTCGQSSLKKNWYIWYYFKDDQYWDQNPGFAQKHPYGFLVRVKGMNKFSDLKDRRDATRALIENELTMLREHTYNPMAKIQTIKVTPTAASEYEISPDLPWLQALDKVMISLGVKCKKDFRSTIKIVGEAARQLNYDAIAIKDIRRKNIKIILEHLKATRNKPAEGNKKARHWGPASYNRFRAHLISLFKELSSTSLFTREVLPTPVIPQRLMTSGRRCCSGNRYQGVMSLIIRSIMSSNPTNSFLSPACVLVSISYFWVCTSALSLLSFNCCLENNNTKAVYRLFAKRVYEWNSGHIFLISLPIRVIFILNPA